MRKIILLIIQKIFFLGTILMLLALYILRYFTMRKMGMARYMVYFREKWSGKELGGFSLLQWGVLAILLLLSLVLFSYYKKTFLLFWRKDFKKEGRKRIFSAFFCFLQHSAYSVFFSLLFFSCWVIGQRIYGKSHCASSSADFFRAVSCKLFKEGRRI